MQFSIRIRQVIYGFTGLFLISLLPACKKDTISLAYTEIVTGTDTKLRGIYFFDEQSGFVCGGEKNESGLILKTTDGGQTWQQVFSATLALRDITFVNDSLGFACGDSLLIVKTTDGGQTWNRLPLPYTPVVITPFTSIQFRDADHGYVCGGHNWEEGIAMRTSDGGVWWEYQAFYNTELSENYFFNDSAGYLTAYGAVYRATADALVNPPLHIDGDFFTSVCFTSADEGFICGYDGGIYKTINAGADWKQVRKDNQAFSTRTHFNKIRFADASRGLAIGNEGAVFFSDDAGESWLQSDNFPEQDMYSMFILNSNAALICGDAGKIWKVEF